MKPVILFYSLCVLASWIPLYPTSKQQTGSTVAFPGWASAPIPAGSSNVPLDPRAARFAADFPGKISIFTDGTRTFVVRWMRTPTRKLHPASDCLRGLGYNVQPTPIFAAADGSNWGTSSARRGTERLCVSERITDSTGREWTDVSSWFWSAALGHSAGPWWAVTILEPADKVGLKVPL
jgi:hypothetical protein